jgi:ADP-heptose:LPS heptosyltransferase
MTAMVFVGDTGPLHVALGVAPRVLTFHQSTTPELTRFDRPGYLSLYKVVCPYQPCDTQGTDKCHLECRQSIPPSEMLAAARTLLDADDGDRAEGTPP